jgi:hypothetical protein
MKPTILALVLALLPVSALAGERDTRQPKLPASRALHPPKPNPCAIYGAGFVQIAGTSTCIKIGGSARTEIGSGPYR